MVCAVGEIVYHKTAIKAFFASLMSGAKSKGVRKASVLDALMRLLHGALLSVAGAVIVGLLVPVFTDVWLWTPIQIVFLSSIGLLAILSAYLIASLLRVHRADSHLADALIELDKATSDLMASQPSSEQDVLEYAHRFCRRIRGALLRMHDVQEDKGLHIWLSASHPRECAFQYKAIESHEDLANEAEEIRRKVRQPLFSVLKEKGPQGETSRVFYGSVASRALVRHLEVKKKAERPRFASTALYRRSRKSKQIFIEYLSPLEGNPNKKHFEIGSHLLSSIEVKATAGGHVMSSSAVFVAFVSHTARSWLTSHDQLLLASATNDLSLFLNRHASLLSESLFFAPGELAIVTNAFEMELPEKAFALGAELDSSRFSADTTRWEAKLAGLESVSDHLEAFSEPAVIKLDPKGRKSNEPEPVFVGVEAEFGRSDPNPEAKIEKHPLGNALNLAADLLCVHSARECNELVNERPELAFLACWRSSLTSPDFRNEVTRLRESLEPNHLGIALRRSFGDEKQLSTEQQAGIKQLVQSGVRIAAFVANETDVEVARELGAKWVLIDTPLSRKGHGGKLELRSKVDELRELARKLDGIPVAAPATDEEYELVRPHVGASGLRVVALPARPGPPPAVAEQPV